MTHSPSSIQVHGILFCWPLSAPLPPCLPRRPHSPSAFPSLPMVPVAVLRLASLRRCDVNGGDVFVIPLRRSSQQHTTSAPDACAELSPAPTFHFSRLELHVRHSPSRDSASVLRGYSIASGGVFPFVAGGRIYDRGHQQLSHRRYFVP